MELNEVTGWNVYTVSSALAALFCFLIAALVGLKAAKTPEKKPFIAVSSLIGVWTLFPFLTSLSSNEAILAIYGRGIYFAAGIAPMTFAWLVNAVLRKTSSLFKILFRLSWGATIVFSVMTFHPLFIKGVQRSGAFRAVDPGPLFHFFVGYFVVLCAVCFAELLRGYRLTEGMKRNQLKYIFMGFMLAYVAGGLHFLAVYLQSEPIPHDIFVIMFTAVLAYAIAKYNLMEINLAFRYASILLMYSLLVALPAITMVWLLQSHVISSILLFVGIVSTPVLYPRLEAWLTTTIDALPPFKGKYERFRYTDVYTKSIVRARSVDEWAWQLTKGINELFEPRTTNVLMFDESLKAFHIKAGINLNPAQMTFMELPLDSAMINHFSNEKCLLLKDRISQSYSEKETESLRSDMNFVCAEVSIPIFAGGDLRAILNIDQKPGNKMYNDLDLATLGALIRSAETTLNAILAGIGLVQATAVWAHDLLKPFGPKGSFRFAKEILDGSFGPVSDELKTAIQLMFLDTHFVAKYLGKVVKPSTSGDTFDIRPRPLTGVYMRVREKYSIAAIESGIKWVVTPPPENMNVLCDMEMIEYRVITNLVENAFRYTPKDGTIELAFKLENDQFIGYVRDTGIGIRKDDLPKVFERGTQLEEVNKGVAGLGLYSVAAVVGAHKGRVWVESEFGKGSTFFFQLPRKN